MADNESKTQDKPKEAKEVNISPELKAQADAEGVSYEEINKRIEKQVKENMAKAEKGEKYDPAKGDHYVPPGAKSVKSKSALMNPDLPFTTTHVVVFDSNGEPVTLMRDLPVDVSKDDFKAFEKQLSPSVVNDEHPDGVPLVIGGDGS